MIEKAYGSKSNLYQAIKHFYHVGRSLANPHNKKHGHVPDYDPKTSKHDQYIRHTEQFLVAYLALPEAAQMLYEHLFGAIRAKYSDAKTAKVYNMGLHMHSTKTCCAPCEYTLLGLMNKRKEFVLDGKSLGFLPNFIKICTLPNPTLQIKVPQKSPFRLIVTTSVIQSDAHHQKQPTYLCKPLKSDEPIPFYDLHVKSNKISQRIFTTMVNSSYDSRRLPLYPSLSDITVGISGSKISPGSEKTKKKARETRQKELDVPKDLRLLLESMKIEDKV